MFKEINSFSNGPNATSLIWGKTAAHIATWQVEVMQRQMLQGRLTKEEEEVIIYEGTEPPFSGKYDDFWEKGVYICKRCNAALYHSEAKFNAGCGWPSFDEEILGAVRRTPDPEGVRTEVSCASCGAHLGHVFLHEGFTRKGVRHCVNSISLIFVPAKSRS